MTIGPARFGMFALALLALACGGREGSQAARAEIERLGHQWEEAANTGQVERLMEVYAADAVILPPGGPLIEGTATIRELFRQEFETFDTKIAFTTQELEVEGDLAYRRGTYVWRGTERGSGRVLETTNKFLEIWKRQSDGSWRIAIDTWNAAGPPAPPGGVGVTTTPEGPAPASSPDTAP